MKNQLQVQRSAKKNVLLFLGLTAATGLVIAFTKSSVRRNFSLWLRQRAEGLANWNESRNRRSIARHNEAIAYRSRPRVTLTEINPTKHAVAVSDEKVKNSKKKPCPWDDGWYSE